MSNTNPTEAATTGVVLFSGNGKDVGQQLAMRIVAPTAHGMRHLGPDQLHAFYSALLSAMLGCMAADYGSATVKEMLRNTIDVMPDVAPCDITAQTH